MRQNLLNINRDKTDMCFFFSKYGESKFEHLLYIGISIEPKTSCCFLGRMIDNNFNFDVQLNKTFAKTANAIRSTYLVRHLLPL